MVFIWLQNSSANKQTRALRGFLEQKMFCLELKLIFHILACEDSAGCCVSNPWGLAQSTSRGRRKDDSFEALEVVIREAREGTSWKAPVPHRIMKPANSHMRHAQGAACHFLGLDPWRGSHSVLRQAWFPPICWSLVYRPNSWYTCMSSRIKTHGQNL